MALDEKDMDIVIDAMDEKKLSAGDTIITQGEKGDELYVVEEGQLDCYKLFVSCFLHLIFAYLDWRKRGKVSQNL